MPDNFDPVAFLGEDAVPPQTAEVPSDFDPERFINDGQKSDPNTGELIPVEFSGGSPATAMNKSPLSTMDRFKLSLGNEQGNLKYLQQKFEQVAPIPGKDGKPTKDLAVLQNGTWHRVDPASGEGMDAWDIAAEYVKDAADLAPIGAGIGVAAATNVATSGMSVPASAAIGGATTALLRTSLGRIVGTYDATPAEQAWDLAFETLLNVGGAKVVAGAKPTAAKVSKWIEPLATKFKDVVDDVTPEGVTVAAKAVANSPKVMFKKFFSALSVGEDNFDLAVQHTKHLQKIMNDSYAKNGSSNIAGYHDDITSQQATVVKDIAQNSRNILSQVYGKMRNKIMDSVGDNFSADFDEALKSTYSDTIKKGLGRLVITSQKVTKGEKDFLTGMAKPDVVEDVSRSLTGTEALEYLAANGLKNAKFAMVPQKELQSAIRQGADLGNEFAVLASDDEAYKLISSYYSDLNIFAGSAKRSGRKAVEALLDFKKLAADKSWSLANSEKAADLPGIKAILDNSRTSMDRSIRAGLDRAGVATQFDKLNKTYSDLSESFAPLLNANHRFKQKPDMKVYETLLGQFLAKPGKQVSKRYAVDAAINAADEHGLTQLSRKMKVDKLQIQLREAAKAFNPLKPTGIKDGKIRAGMGIFAAQAALMGQPALAVALGGGAILTSPALAKAGVMLTNGMSKGQHMLHKMPKDQLDKFLANPDAIKTFTNAIIQTPLVHQDAKRALDNKIMEVGGQ